MRTRWMAVREILQKVFDPEGARRAEKDREKQEKAAKKKAEMEAKKQLAAEKKRAAMEAAKDKADAKKTTKSGADATKRIRDDALKYERALEKQERDAQKAADKAERDAERAANKAADKAERDAERAADKEAARVAKGAQAVAKDIDKDRMADVKTKEGELKKITARLNEFTQGPSMPSVLPAPVAPGGGGGGGGSGSKGKGKAREEAAYKAETARLVLGGIGSGGRGALDWLAEHGPQAPEMKQAKRDREEKALKDEKERLEREIRKGKDDHREFLKGPPGKEPVVKAPKYRAQQPGDIYEKDFTTGESGFRAPLDSERDEWAKL